MRKKDAAVALPIRKKVLTLYKIYVNEYGTPTQ